MRNNTPFKILTTLLAVLITCTGCEKDEEQPVDPSGTAVTYFSGQVGQTNGLVAQVADPANGTTTSVYGTYDGSGAPATITSFRVERTGTDTVVTLTIDPATNNFERALFERNGQRLNYLITFDFPSGDTSMVLNHYDYDWATGEHELIYAGEFYNSQGTVGERPVQLRVDGTQNFITNVAALGVGVGVGIGIAELGVILGAVSGGSLVGTAVGAVATAVAGASVGTLLTVVAVGVGLYALTSDAGASELMPNTSAPQGTPVTNVVNEEPPVNPPTPNPCLDNRVQVTVGVDPGNVLVAIAQGGTYGPYQFYWSNGQTGTANTYHSIQVQQGGKYTATAVDGNGCSGSGSAVVGDSLTPMQKLIQWGPWRSPDYFSEDWDDVAFEVLTFSGVNCQCISVQEYLYDMPENLMVDGNSLCIVDIGQSNVFWYDETCPPDPDDPGVLTIVSVTPTSAVVNASGYSYNLTPL